MLKRQLHAEVISLARVGTRFGLRCGVADAPSLHAKVRPETPYVTRAGTRLFRTGPWPFGVQRCNLSRTFKAIQWEAQPPPATVLATTQGEILVVKQFQPLVVQGSGQDHLQAHDPWKQYLDARGSAAPGPKVKVMSMPSSSQQLQTVHSGAVSQAEFVALAKRLVACPRRLLDTCPPKCIRRWVSGCSKLRLTLTPSLARCVSQHASWKNMAQQVSGRALQAQRKVEARFEQVETQMTALHTIVESQETNLQQVIQGLFNSQTQRFEELLSSKRARGEGQ